MGLIVGIFPAIICFINASSGGSVTSDISFFLDRQADYILSGMFKIQFMSMISTCYLSWVTKNSVPKNSL